MRRVWGVVLAVSVCVCWCYVVGGAFALPPGRHYEMVSPVFKGGYGASRIEGVAPHGEGVAYFSQGVFAGAPRSSVGETPLGGLGYIARRTGSGWASVPLTAPLVLLAGTFPADISPSLGLLLGMGNPGPNSENLFPETDLVLHSTESPDTVVGWEPAGGLQTPEISYRAANVDFCHILFYSQRTLLPGAEPGSSGSLYEFDRGCNGEPSLSSLVGMNNKNRPVHQGCEVDLGNSDYRPAGTSSTFNAIDMDGREVFFTVCLAEPTGPMPAVPHQLFVRLDGSRTLEVSRPLAPACAEVPCNGAVSRGSADFVGASEDGSSVYFTAPLAGGQAPLVPSDTDVSNNLYMATIGCPNTNRGCTAAERVVTALTQVSHDSSGGAAEVQGVLRVAPDGRRVYFVAHGVLGEEGPSGRGVHSKPVQGADNLYVYDSAARRTAFVADLCTGPELSGGVASREVLVGGIEDSRCPVELSTRFDVNGVARNDSGLWLTNGAEAQTAGADGRFLVFAAYAQLTGDDTNTARDVYRYDAETGVLERISIGEDGYDADGNGGASDAEIAPGNHGSGATGHGLRAQYELDKRAISEDGSRIMFTSARPLSPSVSNGGLVNAYEWHEEGPDGGEVSLVSTGSDEQPVTDVVISPDGSSVLFVTVQGLVPQDTDGLPDVYDARLGEGFPQPPEQRRPCEGDACQGPLTNPAPLLIPGSVSQAPGGNWPATKRPVRSKKKVRAKRKRKARTRRARGRRRGRALPPRS